MSLTALHGVVLQCSLTRLASPAQGNGPRIRLARRLDHFLADRPPRSKLIGMALAENANIYWSTILSGIAVAWLYHGYGVVVGSAGNR